MSLQPRKNEQADLLGVDDVQRCIEEAPFKVNGPVVYAAYLKLEHSDENIQFWMACETYKKIAFRWSRIFRAKKLYKIYIQPQSPREINIDSSTRETIIRNIQEPTRTCFEEAQKIVYMHMERDSYPRFLKSEMYQKLLKNIQPNDNS
ncbi:hypothetical protein QTO34_012523 [Cnephaeus nilssonii]|uniref:RGS domain-containing protein n=1 Tax=Cnephaeus nilssonii TaxID=3371016 RepID=A0AA40HCB8_CNENI|nr:hypothetical protein QTO34_012523 [Eptesicus nilssonii]